MMTIYFLLVSNLELLLFRGRVGFTIMIFSFLFSSILMFCFIIWGRRVKFILKVVWSLQQVIICLIKGFKFYMLNIWVRRKIIHLFVLIIVFLNTSLDILCSVTSLSLKSIMFCFLFILWNKSIRFWHVWVSKTGVYMFMILWEVQLMIVGYQRF